MAPHVPDRRTLLPTAGSVAHIQCAQLLQYSLALSGRTEAMPTGSVVQLADLQCTQLLQYSLALPERTEAIPLVSAVHLVGLQWTQVLQYSLALSARAEAMQGSVDAWKPFRLRVVATKRDTKGGLPPGYPPVGTRALQLL